MKMCVFAIFYYNQFLDKQCEKIDRKIEALALNSVLPCRTLYDEITKLSQQKDELINLRVLYNLIVEKLTKEEVDLVKNVAAKIFTVKDSRSSTRGMIKILKRCADVLLNAGYTKEKFVSIYSYLLPKKVLVNAA